MKHCHSVSAGNIVHAMTTSAVRSTGIGTDCVTDYTHDMMTWYMFQQANHGAGGGVDTVCIGDGGGGVGFSTVVALGSLL